MSKKKSLLDTYHFPGLCPRATIKGIFGDPKARIIRLVRRQKKTACGECGTPHRSFYDRKVRRIRDLSWGEMRIDLEMEVRRVWCRRCGKVKQEQFPWLATNPFYPKRFAWYVGRRCRATAVKEVAKELKLDWKTVKSLEKEYMREQLQRTGTPGPKALGIDEISIKKGHSYRIVVSDLVRRRPIWFGGIDRSEQSMDLFYEWLAAKKTAGIQLAVMDRWRAFETSTVKHASQAAILYDKFHVMRHLGKALDTVRKQEYKRLADKDRAFIKGQKYPVLSRKKNLSLAGRKALQKLLAANKRLQYGLSAEGILRPVMGVSERRLGAAVFRELEGFVEVAAPEAL